MKTQSLRSLRLASLAALVLCQLCWVKWRVVGPHLLSNSFIVSTTENHDKNRKEEHKEHADDSSYLSYSTYNELPSPLVNSRVRLFDSSRNDTVVAQISSMFQGARFPNGSFGFVADPTFLKKSIQQFFFRESQTQTDKTYFNLLQNYESEYRKGVVRYGDEALSEDLICGFGAGRGMEQDGGFKLLVDKIRINHNSFVKEQQGSKDSNTKIFCGIYTYSGMRDLTRAQGLSWGKDCDGFLAFSNETIPSLGMVDLTHSGAESYNTMWQKTRSIWAYIYLHYLGDYDFFHLGGDDMYVMVDNLRHLLDERQASSSSSTSGNNFNAEALYLGQWVKNADKSIMIAGGPGYTMSREAVRRFVEEALPSCHADKHVSYEDRLMSKCMESIGVERRDTRDAKTGEQTYHDVDPAHLFTVRADGANRGGFHAKAAAFWEELPHPSRYYSDQTVGPKHKLEAAAAYSVSLHNLYTPQYVARIHSILFRTCPATTPLGYSLDQFSQAAL